MFPLRSIDDDHLHAADQVHSSEREWVFSACKPAKRKRDEKEKSTWEQAPTNANAARI